MWRLPVCGRPWVVRASHLLTVGIASGLALLSGGGSCRGSVVVNIGGGEFRNASNAPLESGSLLQLILLGGNGVFDAINVTDGGSPWVSGDDALLSAAFTTGAGAPADFPSTDAFDLLKGNDTPGTLDRVFEFGSDVLPMGAKLGIRWFPNIQASSFASATLQTGQAYGQFTRQQAPLHGGILWIVPADGANVTFDPLLTLSFGGMDTADAGSAGLVVVPEPSTTGLVLFGGSLFLIGCRWPRERDDRGWRARPTAVLTLAGGVRFEYKLRVLSRCLIPPPIPVAEI